MLITTGGVLVRTRVAEIREMGRATQGVTLIAIDEGTTLSGVRGFSVTPLTNGRRRGRKRRLCRRRCGRRGIGSMKGRATDAGRRVSRALVASARGSMQLFYEIVLPVILIIVYSLCSGQAAGDLGSGVQSCSTPPPLDLHAGAAVRCHGSASTSRICRRARRFPITPATVPLVCRWVRRARWRGAKYDGHGAILGRGVRTRCDAGYPLVRCCMARLAWRFC